MTKLVKEKLLNEIYDLVLSVDIKDEERQALLTFKNAVEAGQDFDRAVMSLASDLRRIGVANIAKKTKMSASVNTFYQKIATYGEFEKISDVVLWLWVSWAVVIDNFSIKNNRKHHHDTWESLSIQQLSNDDCKYLFSKLLLLCQKTGKS